jgi:hypothetical protein
MRIACLSPLVRGGKAIECAAVRLTLVLVLLAAVACDRHGAASASGVAASAAAASAAPAAPPLHGTPCGDGTSPASPESGRNLEACAQYASAREALDDVLALQPRALGVGEAHAPKGATAPSAAKHFTDELLPPLAGRTSDLLVELMMPPRGCLDAAAEVKRAQQPITQRQAETDQNEYLVMGERARALGVVPDMLRPSCADMDMVRDAGDDVVGASLSLIARLSGAQAGKLLDRDERSDADLGKMVVVYGGLLHNDLTPPPERAGWSYAVGLDAKLHGRFVALDLVVPEYITDDESWRSLPWHKDYDRAKLGAKVTLLRTDPRSFVLLFPETKTARPRL